MLHDISKCIPLGSHLDFWEECLYHQPLKKYDVDADLTLTDKKAMAAPSMEANEAIKNPGQIPYVNPMSDMEPANPKRGG